VCVCLHERECVCDPSVDLCQLFGMYICLNVCVRVCVCERESVYVCVRESVCERERVRPFFGFLSAVRYVYVC